jgi:hypothetical protein
MGALVSLHRGWGLPVRVLFDSDQGGKDGKRKLIQEFAFASDEIFCLSDLCSEVKSIEDIFSEGDRLKMEAGVTSNKKSQLRRRAQEILAAKEPIQFDLKTMQRMHEIIAKLTERCPHMFKKATVGFHKRH